MMKKLFSILAILLALSTAAMAQVTTSGVNGIITSGGDRVIGATITATHIPSGTVYRAVTNADGRYTIQGMRVGGPYQVEVTYLGHQPKTFSDVTLNLGETRNLSCSLEEDAKELQELVVTGRSGIDATKTGAALSINSERINDMPSISHGIADVARLNPQLTVTNSGVMSFAGANNRYNSFMIDGAMNNDVFGLASSGNNGGQAGTNPVSMETIEQIQVNVAPFDVRQSGFTGGAINAITKSGTNQFHGSLYGYGYNKNLIGKKYKKTDGTYSDAYDNQKEYQFGVTLGGPIIKNKLFFFANYEKANKEYPNLFGYNTNGSQIITREMDALYMQQYGAQGYTSVGDANADDVLRKINEMAEKQGYHYGGIFENPDVYTKSDKAGVKLDWNINEFNKFSLRWSLVNAKQLNNTSGTTSLNDKSYSYPFKSNTNSFTAELQSRVSPQMSNEFRASYVRVRDERATGTAFPMITIRNVGSSQLIDPTSTADNVTYLVNRRGGTVNIGNERSSMANRLDQDIYTIEDNFTWFRGNHTYTFGTHNELYHFSNLYIQDAFGTYYFNDLDHFNKYYDDFMAGAIDPTYAYINEYRYGHANVEVTGNPRWEAAFTAGQLGFYAQDKWDVSNNFQLTYGLRMDIPIFFDTPAENAPFNAYARGRAYATRSNGTEFLANPDWDVKTNHRLSSAPLWSPRVGFRWDIANNRRYILRGGVGIFTGRIPFVWISNNFSNTGIQLSSYDVFNPKGIDLILNPDGQDANAQKLKATSGSQIINVYDHHFKFAQNLRMNLGFDFDLLGINWTAEAIYSKTLNDIYYKDLSIDESGKTFGQTYDYLWDNRPMMTSTTADTEYSHIYALYNTSKGYTVNLSLKAEKHFNFGLDLMASYTWTRSRSVNNGSSSVAASNFRYNYTYRNPNDPEVGNSAFNVPHRIQASAFYHLRYGANKAWTTTLGVIYQAKSGSPYSIYYYGDVNGDGQNGNDLFFIPTDEQIDQMKFEETTYNKQPLTADMQRALLKEWVGNDSYMSKHRGQYYERYADNLAFEHHFDVHVAQKFQFKVGKQINAIELSLDILNVANLLNKNWGHTYGDGFGIYYSPVNYQGNGYYQFTGQYAVRNYSDYYSRWRGQVGLKYTF